MPFLEKWRCRDVPSAPAVHFAPVPDAHDVDRHDLVLEARNDAPVPDAVFPCALEVAGKGRAELARVGRAQQAVVDEIADAALDRLVEAGERLLGSGAELSGPSQGSSSPAPRGWPFRRASPGA